MTKTTEKPATTKKTTAKRTTKKAQEVESTTPLEMTPEMMMQFQAFLQAQMSEQSTKTGKPKKNKTSKVTKSYIRKEYAGALVSVSSCIHGIVNYRSTKTGVTYTWSEYGDIVDLDVEELLIMPDKFLKSPWLILTEDNGELTQDFATAWGLEDIYKNIGVLDELEDNIEELDLSVLKEIVESLGKNGRVLVGDIAGQVQMAIDSGELDSASKINELSQILGKQLFMPNN